MWHQKKTLISKVQPKGVIMTSQSLKCHNLIIIHMYQGMLNENMVLRKLRTSQIVFRNGGDGTKKERERGSCSSRGHGYHCFLYSRLCCRPGVTCSLSKYSIPSGSYTPDNAAGVLSDASSVSISFHRVFILQIMLQVFCQLLRQ